MTALYEITEQHRALQLLEDDTDIDPQALADTLEGLTGDFEVKAKSVAMFIENLEADSGAIEAAGRLMLARAQRLKARAEAVRTYLRINMEACGFTKISCKWFVIALRKNPPRVDITDADAIPARFLIWPEPPAPVIDKRALAAALKAKEHIPGATLSQDNRVEIRT